MITRKNLILLISAFVFIAGLSIPAMAVDNVANPTVTTSTANPEKNAWNKFKNFSFDGYFWVDPSIQYAHDNQDDFINPSLQGRIVLGVNYEKKINNYFLKARAEILSHVDEEGAKVDTLDTYLQCGNKYWDIQIGRFLAWEIYHKGQGLELYTDEDAGAIDAPNLYEVDFTRGHTDDAVGQIAFHTHPIQGDGLFNLKFEVAVEYGQKSASENVFGVRPVVDFSLWKLQFVAGMEYRLNKSPKIKGANNKRKSETLGYGARLQFNSQYITTGINFARSTSDSFNSDGTMDAAGTNSIMSFGGFFDIDFWKNSIGLGCHYTLYDAENGDDKDHLQPFVSYLYRLPFKGLTVKTVLSSGIAKLKGTGLSNAYTNDMYSLRIRIRYDFM